MKNRIIAICTIVLMSVMVFSLTNCGRPNGNFTGNAVITSHSSSKYACNVLIAFPDGTKESRRVGVRSVCDNFTDRKAVTLKDGYITAYEK